MKYSLSFGILLSLFATALAQTGPEIASYFRKHLSNASAIYLPSESNYTIETTQRWNAFSAPTYVVSVKPTTDRDVQTIVCSSDSNSSQSAYIYQHMPLTSTDIRSHMHIITTYPSSAPAVATATQQLWVRFGMGLKSTWAISTPGPSTPMPTP